MEYKNPGCRTCIHCKSLKEEEGLKGSDYDVYICGILTTTVEEMHPYFGVLTKPKYTSIRVANENLKCEKHEKRKEEREGIISHECNNPAGTCSHPENSYSCVYANHHKL